MMRRSRCRLLNSAALGDDTVEILDRAIEAVDLLVTIRPGLAVCEGGTGPDDDEELRAIRGTFLLCPGFRQTFQPRPCLAHASRGGSEVAFTGRGIDRTGARRYIHKQCKRKRQHGRKADSAAEGPHRDLPGVEMSTREWSRRFTASPIFLEDCAHATGRSRPAGEDWR